jgi:hypothetical protein
MLRISASSVFDDATAVNELLITRSAALLPRKFVEQYKRNVLPLTPKRSGALRRSIVTRASGYQAEIAWRLPYAVDQDAGIDSITGRVYRNYTTPGTGPHFKDQAMALTIRQIDPMFRELGLTK